MNMSHIDKRTEWHIKVAEKYSDYITELITINDTIKVLLTDLKDTQNKRYKNLEQECIIFNNVLLSYLQSHDENA